MSRISSLCRSAAAVLVLAASSLALPGQASENNPVASSATGALPTARVIVRLAASAGGNRAMVEQQATETGTRTALHNAQALSERIGVTLADGHTIDAQTQVVHAAGLTSEALAARLSALGEVEYAVPDQIRRISVAPNDPLYADNQTTVTPVAGQWYLRPPNSTIVSAINAEGAWALTTGSPAIVIADIDTGVRFDHPDLVGKLYPGYDFISNAAIANDGDGRDADASDPGDWVTSADVASGQFTSGCTVSSSSWHGTQTAGILGAATNNGIGMASVGHDVMVQPLRALGKCGGYDSDILAAMMWAAGFTVPGVPANPNPARVINLSLGGTGACTAAYQSAMTQVTAAGVVVVAAAGNESLAVDSPANCAGVIAVGGLRHSGTKVGFSSLGPEVAISAPAGNCVNSSGTCIYPIVTTRNTGTTVPVASSYSDGDSNPSLGTSFSTPMVAGTVALMLSLQPSLTPAQVTSMLKSSARAFPTTGAATGVAACLPPSATAQTAECYCTTTTCGAGMLNAAGAVALAAGSGAPVVTAGISAGASTFTVGVPVTLTASATLASGRSVASYAWSITPGTGNATFSGATNASTITLLPTTAGTVTVTLTVTDSAGTVGTASATYTVGVAVVTPSITAPASIVVGTNATLTGSASVASTRSIAAYQWSVANGSGAASIVGSATGPSVTLAPTAAGTVTVTLRVTDSGGTVGTATQTLTITVPVPIVSAVISTPPALVVGTAVTLSGAGSSVSTGSIAGYAWSIVNGTGTASISGSATGASVTILPQSAGTVIVSLVATDAVGTRGSASLSLVVNAPLVPVIVPATAAPQAGSNDVLSATVTPAGRTISTYAWTIVNGTGTASLVLPTNAASVTLVAQSAGTVTVTLTVTDSLGLQGSTPMMLTITAAATASSTSSSSGGGGGAVGVQWLALLLAAVVALARRPKRRPA